LELEGNGYSILLLYIADTSQIELGKAYIHQAKTIGIGQNVLAARQQIAI